MTLIILCAFLAGIAARETLAQFAAAFRLLRIRRAIGGKLNIFLLL